MTVRFAACLLAVGLIALAAPGCTQGVHQIALYEIASGGALTVKSPDFANGASIPVADTQAGGNHFPGLSWSGEPGGVRSYVLLVQDSDAFVRNGPVLHFTLFDIPAGLTALPAGMTVPPEGSHYGPSYLGDNRPYAGPAPPPGPAHRYHFQVFALDETLPQDITHGGFTALRAAMSGHVLASGETVGTFQR